jgi:hypothetical protein
LYLGAYALLTVSWIGLSLSLKPLFFQLLGVPLDSNKLLAGAIVSLVFGLALRPGLALRLSNLAGLTGGLAVGLIVVAYGNPTALAVLTGLYCGAVFMLGGLLGFLATLIINGLGLLFGKRKAEPPPAG